MGKGFSGSVRRKDPETGEMYGVALTGKAPTAFTLEAFAEAAMSGARVSGTGTEKGAQLVGRNPTITGAAARSAVMALADTEPVPPAVEPPAIPETPASEAARDRARKASKATA
jgi:hypothetical protein